MRGNDEVQGAVFSYISAEQRIAAEHGARNHAGGGADGGEFHDAGI